VAFTSPLSTLSSRCRILPTAPVRHLVVRDNQIRARARRKPLRPVLREVVFFDSSRPPLSVLEGASFGVSVGPNCWTRARRFEFSLPPSPHGIIPCGFRPATLGVLLISHAGISVFIFFLPWLCFCNRKDRDFLIENEEMKNPPVWVVLPLHDLAPAAPPLSEEGRASACPSHFSVLSFFALTRRRP